MRGFLAMSWLTGARTTEHAPHSLLLLSTLTQTKVLRTIPVLNPVFVPPSRSRLRLLLPPRLCLPQVLPCSQGPFHACVLTLSCRGRVGDATHLPRSVLPPLSQPCPSPPSRSWLTPTPSPAHSFPAFRFPRWLSPRSRASRAPGGLLQVLLRPGLQPTCIFPPSFRLQSSSAQFSFVLPALPWATAFPHPPLLLVLSC